MISPSRWWTRARAVVGVGMLGGAALISLPSVLPSRASATDERPPPTVRVAGQPVELTDAAAQARRIADEWARVNLRLQLTEETLVRTRADLGGSVDVEHLTRLLRDADNPASALRRRAEDARELTLALPVRFDAEPARALLLELKRLHDHSPSDARFDPDTRQIIPQRAGLSLDVWATLDDLDDALHHGERDVAVRVVRTNARRTAEELRDVRVDARLGEFETRYSLNESAADRTHNLRVAASKIDGLVLLPGEVFDFNAVVGERNEASGFRPAPVIAGGELVDGLGGGACQIAGTIHAAAFFAGLTILERHPHSRPSFYIKLGLDAAVSYPSINLVFRNDHPFPVVVRIRLEGGIARSEVLGLEQRDMVTFVRRIDSVQTYTESETQDSSLPSGVRVLGQRGVAGFRVARWRIIRDMETNQARREASIDVYPPTTQIWRVGTGGPPPPDYVAEGDGHPEYTADEYTTMTQGPGIRGTDTVRQPGFSGLPGWTARMGMPQPPAVEPAEGDGN
ncbi:MAG: VanW family protein [Sandaracinaceae bacterium]|nr:VanW family protein [Sandaracinaceae bacterium]